MQWCGWERQGSEAADRTGALPPTVEVRPASGESLPLEPHAVISLSAWTQLCSMAFVEPLKHTDDVVS